MKLTLLSSLLLAAGLLAPAVPVPASHLPLPPASGPLVFEPGAKEIGLGELVQGLARLTRQELAMSQPTQQLLQGSKEPLESAEPVPAEEVYSFVEGLLARQGFVIAPITGGSRPILGVTAGAGNGREVALDALYVEPSARPELEAHPGLLVRMILEMENTDTRQVQTQLRQLMVDTSGLNQVVPVGEHSLILQGRARDIAGLAKLLDAADEAAGKRPAPAPEPAAKGPAK